MNIRHGDRTVIANATPRLIEAPIFFDDWITDSDNLTVKNPGTAEWAIFGRHRLFGKFFARWAKGAVGDIVLCASQI